MKVIERQMQVTETAQKNNYAHSQASINSDGCITVRNFSLCNKNADEIIIFTREETKAIFNLFNRLSEMGKDWLPF